ncbi:hypothetical protein CATMIT_01707, partial [Catenibacterium mitsuokai DSM 15897]
HGDDRAVDRGHGEVAASDLRIELVRDQAEAGGAGEIGAHADAEIAAAMSDVIVDRIDAAIAETR